MERQIVRATGKKTTSTVPGVASCDVWLWKLDAYDSRQEEDNSFWNAYRRMMHVNRREHRSNASIIEELNPSRRLLMDVQSHKLRHFWHLIRAKSVSPSILHGRVEGKKAQGRPRSRWYKNVGRSFFRFIMIHTFDRQTDRQTDIFVMANTALYSMQRGKN